MPHDHTAGVWRNFAIFAVAMSTVPTLQLVGVTTGYARRGHCRRVSADLNLQIEGGRFVALLGPNGAGKSTLLETLAGTLPPLAGRVVLNGRDAETLSRRELSSTVSVVLTGLAQGAGALTAREAVALGRTPYTGLTGRLTEADRRVVDDVMARLGLQHLATRRLADMSDGERQKVMTARAIAQATPIMLLDEPTSFLDFPSQLAAFRLMRRLAHERGKLVIASTHSLGLALQSADLLMLLDGGGGLITGTPHELAQSGALDVFFPPQEGVHFNRELLTYSLTTEADNTEHEERKP